MISYNLFKYQIKSKFLGILEAAGIQFQHHSCIQYVKE